MTTLGQSSIGNGTPLLGMICFAMRTDPVSRPMSGTSARCFGMRAQERQLDRALGSSMSDSFSISTGSTTDGAIVAWLSTCCSTPGVLTTSREQIEQRFAVGEIERRVGVHLAPDEHVFGRQRDLLVAVAHVGAHGGQDLVSSADRSAGSDPARRTGTAGRIPSSSRRRRTSCACRGRGCRRDPSGADVDLARQRLALNRLVRTASSVSADSLRPSTTQSTLSSS